MAKTMKIFIAFLVVLGLCVCIAETTAFSADTLAITIHPSGDADISFGYTLSWIERAAVFFNIADPAREVASAMERQYNRPVIVHQVDPSAVTMTVPGFASVTSTPEGTLYRTPAMDFRNAEQVLNQYWFAPLVNPDFSPGVTTITFPDGQTGSWADEGVIPSVDHLVP